MVCTTENFEESLRLVAKDLLITDFMCLCLLSATQTKANLEPA